MLGRKISAVEWLLLRVLLMKPILQPDKWGENFICWNRFPWKISPCKSLTRHHILSSGLLVASSNTWFSLGFISSVIKSKDKLEDVMQDILCRAWVIWAWFLNTAPFDCCQQTRKPADDVYSCLFELAIFRCKLRKSTTVAAKCSFCWLSLANITKTKWMSSCHTKP